MTTRLTPDQEAIVQRALTDGLAQSAEDFVSEALRNQLEQLTTDARFEQWARDEVVPALREFAKDPSAGKNARDTLAEVLGE